MKRAETIGWTADFGERPYRVVAEERLDRGGKVYLRWREAGNWRVRATELVIRNRHGKVIAAREKQVRDEAAGVIAELQGGRSAAKGARAKPLTLLEGLARVTDPDSGKYPTDSQHRREVEREVRRVAAILGTARTWNSLMPGDIRTIYRRRARALAEQGHVGKRGAEITVSRLLAVAEWLRGEQLIHQGACRAPAEWKKTLGEEVTTEGPAQPRYTLDELRRILDQADRVDPRFAIIARTGVGLRPGQVARARRSHLDLEKERPELVVKGRGAKRGAILVLLPADIAALREALSTGYLAPLEQMRLRGEIEDYPLFPAGQLTGGRGGGSPRCRPEQAHGGHVGGKTIGDWWRRAEELAGVPHLEGRATYGGKRQSVDVAKSTLSRDELGSFGGWADNQMADRVYADQERRDYAAGAARARAAIRGVELEPVTPEA